MNTYLHTPTVAALRSPTAAARPHLGAQLLATLGDWLRRSRDRTALKQLDARLLRDVGLTQEQVRREIDKPFWRV